MEIKEFALICKETLERMRDKERGIGESLIFYKIMKEAESLNKTDKIIEIVRRYKKRIEYQEEIVNRFDLWWYDEETYTKMLIDSINEHVIKKLLKKFHHSPFHQTLLQLYVEPPLTLKILEKNKFFKKYKEIVRIEGVTTPSTTEDVKYSLRYPIPKGELTATIIKIPLSKANEMKEEEIEILERNFLNLKKELEDKGFKCRTYYLITFLEIKLDNFSLSRPSPFFY